jgi:hypothetical protein
MNTIRNRMLGTTAMLMAADTGNGTDVPAPVDKLVLKTIRAAYEASSGNPLDDDAISDDDLAQIVREQGDEASDMDAEGWVTVVDAWLEGDTDDEDTDASAAVLDISASPIKEGERKLAEKLASEEWQAFHNEDIRTREFRNQAVVMAARLIEKDFSKEERDALPLFGTTKDGDVAKGIPASNNPDVYHTKNPLNGKNEKRHRLWDIVDSSPVGVSIWKDYAKVYAARHQIEGYDKALFKEGASWLDTELKMIKQRINTIRNSFINGIKLSLKKDRINSELKKTVAVNWAIGTNGKLRRGSYCVEVADMGKMPDGRPSRAHVFYSSGQVLKLDVMKAVKNGGTYEALTATIARQPKQPQQPSKAVAMPKTKEEFYSLVNMTNHYLDYETTEGRKNIASLIADMDSDKEGSDTAVEAVGDMITGLDANVWKHIEKRYNAIKARKAAQDKNGKRDAA